MSNEALVGNIDIEGIKRCYVDLKLKHTCKCGAELITDLSDNYLSYPEVGEETTVYFYCDACEEEPEVKFLVEAATVTLKPVISE